MQVQHQTIYAVNKELTRIATRHGVHVPISEALGQRRRPVGSKVSLVKG